MRFICFKKEQRIQPIWAWHSAGKKGFKTPIQTVNNAWLFLGYNGKKQFLSNGEEFLVERGSFHIIFPNTLSGCSVIGDEAQSDFCIEFLLPDDYFVTEADNIDEIMNPELCILPEFTRINDCEKYFITFSHLIDELQNRRLNDSYKMEICDNYTKILLCSLADAALRYSVAGKKRISTEKIFYWLGKNAKRGITARDAAKALNYNSDYLNQIIRKETGMTLTKYLNYLRITEAKNLLLNSNIKISQIAYEAGFSDEKYFMRIFKENENMTPIQYRNSHFWKCVRKND